MSTNLFSSTCCSFRCSGFSCCDLGRKSERVGQEQFRETRKLCNFLFAQFVVIVRTVVSVKPNQVRPFLQVIGQLSSFMKGVNSWSEVLSGQSGIDLSRSHVKRLSVHRRSGVRMASRRIVGTLYVRPFYRRGYVLGDLKSPWSWIYLAYFSSLATTNLLKLTIFSRYPAMIRGSITDGNANEIITGVASKHDSWIDTLRSSGRHVRHSDRFRQAMWACAHEGSCHE